MIYQANRRTDKHKGDPKIGGHSSGSSSAIHICGAIHLFVKSGFDHIANKPHASPADHAYNYLLDLFLDENLQRLSLEEANTAMRNLRAFSENGEWVFQSYHSAYDPDRHNFFPSGTVGIPPVKAGYMAHAYTFAKNHGYKTPDAHFWAIIGDSEFREGSLFEAVPDFAEREIGNLTWIVDYNRQSLDGHRINNKKILGGTDALRIEKTMAANGWEVIQVRHGAKREKSFTEKGGEAFKNWLENKLEDYELQALLLMKDKNKLFEETKTNHKEIKDLLLHQGAEKFYDLVHDFGGHDMPVLISALETSKKSKDRPTMIVAHTLKGWNLQMAAQQGNHSALPEEAEMQALRQSVGLDEKTDFGRFAPSSAEGKFLTARAEDLFRQIKEQNNIKDQNRAHFDKKLVEFGEIPETLNINLKMASYPHTQWMLGQLTSKLTRVANTPLDNKKLADKQKPLGDDEKVWKLPAELMVSMAPDVGTSTNLNPSMDGKIFGAIDTEDYETEYDVKDKSLPDLVPSQEENHRFIRFEIAESNVTSCLGAYGRLRDILGIPIIPLMTVYDFFVKRALDQHFYNLYWKSSFIMCGTPSGVTLSPEGAQHGWKSDMQIPNQITWEPFFCIELDWILCDAIRRHVNYDNEGRTGVHIRGVTRGIEQKDLMRCMKQQIRFAEASDEQIMSEMRQDVLAGAYYLLNYEGYQGYEPGDNVVNIFTMGAIGTEAIKASEKLLELGVYANVIMVTSTDLLVGNLAHENDYSHLKNKLAVNANLHLLPQLNGNPIASELVTLAGRRVPIVSAHDGEPGLLDNLGSVVGVKQEALAVRHHSKCGRPDQVYQYHHIDETALVEACKKALAETALEQIQVKTKEYQSAQPKVTGDWQQLWPQQNESQ